MFDLTLSPAQTEFTAQPGATITQAYDVINNSDSIITVNTSVRPWQPLGNNGGLTYSNVPTNPNFDFSLANADLHLGQSFILRPGQKQQLVLKIKSTATTPQTDSYFTFFVSQDTTDSLNADSTGGQTAAEIGSHLLISTSATESYPLKSTISRFSLQPYFKDIFFPSLTFSGLVTNQTDHFFKIDGQITLTKNDLTLKQLTLFPANVLANHSRQINCLQDNQPVSCRLDPPFWPGLYQATLQTNNTSQTISFFVFPYSFFFLILFFFLPLIIKKVIRH